MKIKLFESFVNEGGIRRQVWALSGEMRSKINSEINNVLIELTDNGFEIEIDHFSKKIAEQNSILVSVHKINNNERFNSLEEIPEDIIFSDIIAFDLFFTSKSGYLTENNKQEPDKDWSVNSKGSSKVNRFHFDNGFLSDEEGLRERVRDIFIELEDTSHDVTIDIDKLSISVFIDASDTIVRAGTNYSPINNELNEYSIDYDLTKDCCETFIEYIKDRNPNVDSRLGLNTKYTIEYYDLEKGSGTKEWIREYSEEFPRIELKNKITELKITLSV